MNDQARPQQASSPTNRDVLSPPHGIDWQPYSGTRTRRSKAAQDARTALQTYRREPDNNAALIRALVALKAVVEDQSAGQAFLRWWM